MEAKMYEVPSAKKVWEPLLRLTFSSASSFLRPTSFMSSFTASVNLLFGRPLGLLSGSSNLSTPLLSIYSLSLLMSKPSQSVLSGFYLHRSNMDWCPNPRDILLTHITHTCMTCVQSLACNMSQTPNQENMVLFLHHIFNKNNSAVQLDGELGAFFSWCPSHVGLIVWSTWIKSPVFVWSHVFAPERVSQAPLLICLCPCFLFSPLNRKEESWPRVTDRKPTSKPTRKRQMISRKSRMNTDADGPLCRCFRPCF